MHACTTHVYVPSQVGGVSLHSPELPAGPTHVLTVFSPESPNPLLQLYVAVSMNPREELVSSE